MVLSTTSPALTSRMIRRGRRIDFTNASRSLKPAICLPALAATNLSTGSGHASHAATEKPFSSMLSARFRPITPSPTIPIAISPIGVSCPSFGGRSLHPYAHYGSPLGPSEHDAVGQRTGLESPC